MRTGLAWMGLSLILVACGGATATDLQSDASPNGNGNTDAGGGGPDATTGKDSGPPVQDASPVDDGATTIDVDVPDVPVGPPDSLIDCGGSKCSAQKEFCCRTGQYPYSYACVPQGDKGKCGGQGDVPITCSSGDNCGSQGNAGWQCCAQVAQTQQCLAATQTVCKSACDTQVGEFQVGCDPQQANSCGPNAYCKVSTCSLYGYPICIAN